MENASGIYREKSLKRVSSPEELDEYIRVTNPGVWLLLIGIVIFLLGICAWGVFGRLETTLDISGKTENGQFTGYVTAENAVKVTTGMKVRSGNAEGVILEISLYPEPAGSLLPAIMLKDLSLTEDTPLFPLKTDLKLPEGRQDAQLVLEEINPISLLFD